MGLGQEINQKKFRNEHQKGVINLIFTFNWVNGQMKSLLDPFGITSQQFNILRILRGAGQPLSTLQIRQRMLDKMSDTSRIVDRLIIKGLAKKVVCKGDKRLVDVTITDKGKKLLERTDKHENEMDAIVSSLSEKEAGTLNKLLDKIRQSH